MNKVYLIGRLTADPEARTAQNGTGTVTTFSLAVNTRRKDAQGDEITNFYRINVWRQLGENCMKYLHKGDRCSVTGNLVVTTYTNKNGQAAFSLDVTADDVEFLTEKKTGEQAQQAQAAPTPPPTAAPVSNTGDDLPF